jgi:hypothetical protein
MVASMQEAFNTQVLARLEQSFGKAVATMIVASASSVACASTVDLRREDYLALCEAICADQRVVDMWGSAETEYQLKQWREKAGA